jgi:soluble lytic murein transglycosylase-like protein
VLLDFSREPATHENPASETDEAPIDVDALSRMMVNQFTGAPQSSDTVAPSFAFKSPTPGINPAAMGNPFSAYALPSGTIMPTVGFGSVNNCVMPTYRPNYAFGRKAEERRRVIFPLVHQIACEAGLPVGLFDAMIMQESGYRPNAISSAGAVGLAQLMPGTAVQLGVDRYSLVENLRGGARYLKQHVDRFGRYDLALAAYNAGPKRVERSWQIPRITETQNYVRAILTNWSGAPTTHTIANKPRSYRQAQMIFMPYLPIVSGN